MAKPMFATPFGSSGNRVLDQALDNDDGDKLERLIRDGDVNAYGALPVAASRDAVQCGRFLLPYVTSGYVELATIKAIRDDAVAFFDMLLDETLDVDAQVSDGRYLVSVVIGDADPKLVPQYLATLLPRGANLDVFDNEGDSPLHVASILGQHQAVQALLQAGADPLARNAAGKRPAELAADRGYVEAAEAIQRFLELDREGSLTVDAEKAPVQVSARPF